MKYIMNNIVVTIFYPYFVMREYIAKKEIQEIEKDL